MYSRLSRRTSSGRISLSSVTFAMPGNDDVGGEEDQMTLAERSSSSRSSSSGPSVVSHLHNSSSSLDILGMESDDTTTSVTARKVAGSKRKSIAGKAMNEDRQEDKENSGPNGTSAPKRRRSAPASREPLGGSSAPAKRKTSLLAVPKKTATRSKLNRRASEDHFHLENLGEQTTILDELNYELEGASSTSSISVRRGSTHNLAKLCSQPEEVKLLRARGQCRRVLRLLDAEHGDEIVAMNVSMIAYFLLKDARNAELFTARHLHALLSIAAEPIIRTETKAKPSPKKRYDSREAAMKRSVGLIEEEAGMHNWPEITASRIAYETLRRLAQVDRSSLKRALEEVDDDDEGTSLDTIFGKIRTLAHVYLHKLSCAPIDALSCLSLLEATSDNASYHQFLTSLVPSLLQTLARCIGEEQVMMGQCLTSVLRVLINLANDNDHACTEMARNGGLEAVANLVEEAWTAEATAFGEQKWNVLTLGMSLLVNLVEHNEANREELGSFQTRSSREFMDVMAEVINHWWDADRKADQVIVAGYGVLLVTYMVKDHEGNKANLRKKLTELKPSRSLLELSTALRHFLGLQDHHRLLSPLAISSAAQAARSLLI